MALLDTDYVDETSNAGLYPSVNGVGIDNAVIAVLGGTTSTFAAVLQMKSSEGTWHDMPDPDGDEDISGICATLGGYIKSLQGGAGMKVRIKVTNKGASDWAAAIHDDSD